MTHCKIFLMASLMFVVSCNKKWLDEKPSQSLVTLNSVKDLQKLLDNTSVFNSTQPSLGEQGTSHYHIAKSAYDSRGEKDQNVYSWGSSSDFYGGQALIDWEFSYSVVFTANVVLENLVKIEKNGKNSSEWENVRGSALFYRANAFFNLAQIFCKPFIQSSANSDLGLIIRTSPDINIHSRRSTVQETYNQIITDLLEAKDLLPSTPAYRTRPCRPAVYALLARAYMCVGDYNSALLYSDLCLMEYNTLLDYNAAPIVANNSNPFPLYPNNTEVIFYSTMTVPSMMPHRSGVGFVDSVLFQSYSTNDKRKTLFFRKVSNRLAYIGTYSGRTTGTLFNGLATDEMYLTRAECYARSGNVTKAMGDLNMLLEKRWATGLFVPVNATDPEDALRKILVEREKQLCFRSIRWTDLRRLNLDNRFAITLSRGLLNSPTSINFELPPNDNRYVYPIPNSEILYSDVQQNPR